MKALLFTADVLDLFTRGVRGLEREDITGTADLVGGGVDTSVASIIVFGLTTFSLPRTGEASTATLEVLDWSVEVLMAVEVRSLGLMTVEVTILDPSTLSTPAATSRVPRRGPFLQRICQLNTTCCMKL